MTKKLISTISSFLIGLMIGGLMSAKMADVTMYLFQLTTDWNWKFIMITPLIRPGIFYFSTFGFAFAIIELYNKSGVSKKQIISNGSIFYVLTIILFFVVCAIHANLTIMTCTICQGKEIAVNLDALNIGNHLAIALIVGILPTIFKLVKKLKKPPRQSL